MNVSGVLQSPLTSLLSVSSGVVDGRVGVLSVSSSVIDGKVGTIIGISIPQFLTRNETALPSSFVSSSANFNFSNNLNVSGTLQSPLTSLLSVSSGVVDGKVGVLGVSSGVIDAKLGTILEFLYHNF